MKNRIYVPDGVTTALLLLIIAVMGTALPIWAIEWSLDTQLTTYSEAWDESPSIIQTVDGSIWVVWQSDRGVPLQYDLYYRNSSDYGLTWSPDTRLTTDLDFDVMPSIIQTVDGSIWVVWSSDRMGDYEVFYKTSSDYGLTWSPDTRLTTNSSWDMSASITQDTNGRIWVVWERYTVGISDLYYKTSSDYGLTWSPDIQLTTDSSFDKSPSITQICDGSLWVVWHSDRTGDYEVFCKISSDYGLTWSPDIQLTTDSDFDEEPTVAQARDCSLWVVWHSDRGGGKTQYDLYYKTSTDYGLTWSSDTQLTTDNDDDMSPSITKTQDGKMWIVWTSLRTGDFEIFYKTSESFKFPGDIDGDGDVDPNDLYLFSGAYGTNPPSNPDCDLDHDGDVDPADLHILAGNYGKSC